MPLTKIQPLAKDRERLENRLKEIPPEPGVYIMRDGSDNRIYIGKSKKLRSRVRSYFQKGQALSARIALMVSQVCEIEFIVTDTEAEALALEANLIKEHQPNFNVLLKDDKKYPFLCITWSEKYPRIFITRKRQLRHSKDRYYGPYVDSGQLRNTLQQLKRIFPLRQRPQPLYKDRPCLNYDIGRCPGVCQGLITPEEYRQTVEKVAMIFQGRIAEPIAMLTKQMEKAAEGLLFEQAARIRDRIAGLKALASSEQKVSLPDDTISRDAIALASSEQHACIQLFQMRAGQLVGRLGFVAEAADTGEILQRVLEEHYQNVEPVEIPAEIIVQQELPEAEILADWLSSRKGRKVTIFAPQRQTKAELIAMVERNAEYELARMQRASDRNAKAMQDLAELLDLPEIPHRIECYDISHIQGSDAVASRVVFIDGLPAKQHYRHYKIKNSEVYAGHSDDFASLAEVIGRRFREYAANPEERENLEPEPAEPKSAEPESAKPESAKIYRDNQPQDWPDLVVIDGGKGQLSAVVEVLQDMNLMENLRTVSLAKQREEIFMPGESLPVPSDSEQPGVQLLRRCRDEAHRFAVSFHRQKRTQRMRRSRLDDIPGLGHERQKQLLAHFRSVDYIGIATPEQLAEVPGIGPSLAREIYAYFHP